MHHLLVVLSVLAPRDTTDKSPPVVGTHLVEISALIGSLIPIVVQFTKQDGLSKLWNSIIAVLTCLVAAVITCLAQGQLHPHDVLGSLLAVYTLAVATYHGLWSNIPLLQEVKERTSIVKRPRRHIEGKPPLA